MLLKLTIDNGTATNVLIRQKEVKQFKKEFAIEKIKQQPFFRGIRH